MFDTTNLTSAISNLTAYKNSGVTEKKDPIVVFYERLTELGFNLGDLQTFLETDGNILAIACAGSGKTTALVLRCIYDYLKGTYVIEDTVTDSQGNVLPIKRNAKILVSTFLKTGAAEIKQRFVEWCNKLGVTGIDINNITFTTLHAELYSALRSMGLSGRIWENTGDVVRFTMQHFNIRNKITGNTKVIPIEEVSDVQSIFTYYRNWLDETRYQHPLMEDYGLTPVLLDTAVKWYIDYITLQNAFDFETLEELLFKYMKENPNVYNFLASRYDFVYVDEFQDISQLQYAVLRPYFDGAKRIIVIGDDDQTIYSWRGSDIDIIVNKFPNDYKTTTIKLGTNYRCGCNILNAVIPSIEQNKKRNPKTIKAYNSGGKVTIDTYSTQNPITFLRNIENDMVDGKTVSVISRTNADLLVPTILLELFSTIKFSLSKNVSLGTKIPRMIFGAIDLLTKGWQTEDDYSMKLLKGFFGYNANKDIGKLDMVLRNNPSMSLMDLELEDCRYSLPTIYPFLVGLYDAYGDGDDIGLRDAYTYMLKHYVTNVFVKDNSFHIKARELARFVIMLINTEDFLGGKSFDIITTTLQKELPERLLARTKYNKENDVVTAKCALTTVHECKGKEWDTVYIWNDNDGTFPVKMSAVTDISEATYEEERRLHYIAWTRARTHLVVLTDPTNPSPFLLECTLDGDGIVGSEDIKLHKQENVMRVHKHNNYVYENDFQIAVSKEAFVKVFMDVLDGNDCETKRALYSYAQNGALEILAEMWVDYTKRRVNAETITFAQLSKLIIYSGKEEFRNNLQTIVT